MHILSFAHSLNEAKKKTHQCLDSHYNYEYVYIYKRMNKRLKVGGASNTTEHLFGWVFSSQKCVQPTYLLRTSRTYTRNQDMIYTYVRH